MMYFHRRSLALMWMLPLLWLWPDVSPVPILRISSLLRQAEAGALEDYAAALRRRDNLRGKIRVRQKRQKEIERIVKKLQARSKKLLKKQKAAVKQSMDAAEKYYGFRDSMKGIDILIRDDEKRKPAGWKKEVAGLKKKKSRMKKEMAVWRKKKERAGKAVDRFTAEIRQMKYPGKESSKVELDLITLKGNLRWSYKEVVRLGKRLKMAERNLVSAKADVKKREKRLAESKKEFQAAMKKLRDKSKEVDRMIDRVQGYHDRKEKVPAGLRKKLAGLKRDYFRLQKRAQGKEAAVPAAEKKLRYALSSVRNAERLVEK